MRVLVTGGAGFIGRHLVDSLVKEGKEVVVLDSGHCGQITRVNKKAMLIQADIDSFKIDDFIPYLKGVSQVFHLAAQKHNTLSVSPEKMISTNILSTYNLVLASARLNIKRFVFTSSLYAYGSLGPKIMNEKDPPMPSTLYGASKLMGENILRLAQKQFGLSWNVARLFFIYGPGQFAGSGYKSVIVKNFERIKNKMPVTINGDGNQSLDYLYVQDAVEGLKLLANSKKDHKTFNISSSTALSINELVLAMEKSFGKKVNVSYEPADWTSGSCRFGDNRLMKNEFGWTPKVNLNEGLNRTWEFIKTNNISGDI